jgi:hypothetical protein
MIQAYYSARSTSFTKPPLYPFNVTSQAQRTNPIICNSSVPVAAAAATAAAAAASAAGMQMIIIVSFLQYSDT